MSNPVTKVGVEMTEMDRPTEAMLNGGEGQFPKKRRLMLTEEGD